MTITMKVYGLIDIDTTTGVISGDTYKSREWIKENFDAKWDRDARVWRVDTKKLAAELEKPYYNKYIVARSGNENAAKTNKVSGNKADKAASEKAIAERKAKTAAIEGLEEIRSAIHAAEQYHRDFNRMMDDEYNDGVNPPERPTTNIAELKARYPRAAAYLVAESYSYADHYVKAGAGKRAVERIINGEDYNKVLADMKAEWDAHCAEHIWD